MRAGGKEDEVQHQHLQEIVAEQERRPLREPTADDVAWPLVRRGKDRKARVPDARGSAVEVGCMASGRNRV